MDARLRHNLVGELVSVRDPPNTSSKQLELMVKLGRSLVSITSHSSSNSWIIYRATEAASKKAESLPQRRAPSEGRPEVQEQTR